MGWNSQLIDFSGIKLIWDIKLVNFKSLGLRTLYEWSALVETLPGTITKASSLLKFSDADEAMAHRRRVSFFCFCFSIFFSLVTTWFQFRIIFCDLTFAQILQSWFTDLLFGVSLLSSRVDLFPVCYQRPFHQPLGYPRYAFHEVRYVALLFSFVPLESLFPDSGMFSGASSDPPPTTILSSSAILTVLKTVDDGRPRRDVVTLSPTMNNSSWMGHFSEMGLGFCIYWAYGA